MRNNYKNNIITNPRYCRKHDIQIADKEAKMIYTIDVWREMPHEANVEYSSDFSLIGVTFNSESKFFFQLSVNVDKTDSDCAR